MGIVRRGALNAHMAFSFFFPLFLVHFPSFSLSLLSSVFLYRVHHVDLMREASAEEHYQSILQFIRGTIAD